jgi:hypothetical protein
MGSARLTAMFQHDAHAPGKRRIITQQLYRPAHRCPAARPRLAGHAGRVQGDALRRPIHDRRRRVQRHRGRQLLAGERLARLAHPRAYGRLHRLHARLPQAQLEELAQQDQPALVPVTTGLKTPDVLRQARRRSRSSGAQRCPPGGEERRGRRAGRGARLDSPGPI